MHACVSYMVTEDVYGYMVLWQEYIITDTTNPLTGRSELSGSYMAELHVTHGHLREHERPPLLLETLQRFYLFQLQEQLPFRLPISATKSVLNCIDIPVGNDTNIY